MSSNFNCSICKHEQRVILFSHSYQLFRRSTGMPGSHTSNVLFALFSQCWLRSFDTIEIQWYFPMKLHKRYFNMIFLCLCAKIKSIGRTATLGLGFGDRSDSFDLNVALQDHFKWVKNQEKIEQDKVNPKPELDLGFKEGETIKINMKITVSATPSTRFALPLFLFFTFVCNQMGVRALTT